MLVAPMESRCRRSPKTVNPRSLVRSPRQVARGRGSGPRMRSKTHRKRHRSPSQGRTVGMHGGTCCTVIAKLRAKVLRPNDVMHMHVLTHSLAWLGSFCISCVNPTSCVNDCIGYALILHWLCKPNSWWQEAKLLRGKSSDNLGALLTKDPVSVHASASIYKFAGQSHTHACAACSTRMRRARDVQATMPQIGRLQQCFLHTKGVTHLK